MAGHRVLVPACGGSSPPSPIARGSGGHFIGIRHVRGMDVRDVHWLAGLLEGEGYFGLVKNRDRWVAHLSLSMTDEDVVARAADLIGVSVGRTAARRVGWRATYRVAAKGSRALEIMRLVHPLCGERRTTRIDDVLARHEQRTPPSKLTVEDVRQIRRRLASGAETQTALADAFGVTRRVIRLVRDGIRREEPGRRPIGPFEVEGVADQRLLNLAWLAGLLEGEGSFMLPPPSAPRSPLVVLQMTDRDVVERAASLIGVSCYAMPLRNPNHRPVFMARARGLRAVSVMTAITDQMGQRRSERIAEAVASYCPQKPSQKLTVEQAREVARRRRAGDDSGRLATEFQVSRRTVNRIAQGLRNLSDVELIRVG